MNLRKAIAALAISAAVLTGGCSAQEEIVLDESLWYACFEFDYPSEWTREKSNDDATITLHLPSGGVLQVHGELLDTSIDSASDAVIEQSFDAFFQTFVADYSQVGEYTRDDGDDYFLATAPLEMQINGTDYSGEVVCMMSDTFISHIAVVGSNDEQAAIDAVIDSIEVDL